MRALGRCLSGCRRCRWPAVRAGRRGGAHSAWARSKRSRPVAASRRCAWRATGVGRHRPACPRGRPGWPAGAARAAAGSGCSRAPACRWRRGRARPATGPGSGRSGPASASSPLCAQLLDRRRQSVAARVLQRKSGRVSMVLVPQAANLVLASVPRVASTPMRPVRVSAAAGLSAGSMPTMTWSGLCRAQPFGGGRRGGVAGDHQRLDAVRVSRSCSAMTRLRSAMKASSRSP